MSRHIQLIQQPVTVYTPAPNLGLRFTVTAVNGNLMPNEIFKVLARPINPNNTSGPTQVVFLAICTPSDLLNLQIDSPPAGVPAQPYRVAYIDLTYDNEADSAQGWADIQSGALQLVNELNGLDVLSPGNTVSIGAYP